MEQNSSQSYNDSAGYSAYGFLAHNNPLENLTCIVGDLVPTEDPLDKSIFKKFNAPTQPPEIPWWEILLKVVFYVISFSTAVVGNVMVILIICLNKRMRNTTNVLLLNQAVADLLVALFCMWVHLGNQITPEWPFGLFVCKFTTFSQVVAVTASVLTLTAVSVERFTAIVFPLKARWTGAVSGAIIAVTWLMAVAVASPHLFVRVVYEQEWKDRHETWCDENWPKVFRDSDCNAWEPGKIAYYMVQAFVMYFLPVLIMIVVYSIITYKLLTHKIPGTLINTTVSTQEKAKRKVIKMLVAVLVCFVVCWTPQHITIIWDLLRTKTPVPQYMKSVKFAAVYIAYLNSALNPIIYGGFNDNFRRGFYDVCRCLISKPNKVHPAPPAAVNMAEQGEATPDMSSRIRSTPQPRDSSGGVVITVSTFAKRDKTTEDSGRPTTAGTDSDQPNSVITTGHSQHSVNSDDTTVVPWQSLHSQRS